MKKVKLQWQSIYYIKKSRGIALITVLLFLTAITGITLWATTRSLISENTARNHLDQEVARMAAEAALRDAERDILTLNPNLLTNASCTRGLERQLLLNDFNSTCINGLCKPNSTFENTDWKDANAGSTLSEVWWPESKGGLWNNNFVSKPGRDPVNTTNCGFTGGVPLGTYTGAIPIVGTAAQPEYMIEAFDRKYVRANAPETMMQSVYCAGKTGCPMFRITARGFGYTQRTQVVLQTIYYP